MPIYVYACSDCDTEFELRLRMSQNEEPLAQPCPECGSTGKITQQITTASFLNPEQIGVKRPDAGFTEVLDKIKSHHPKGNWGNSKFGRTSGL